jgi:molybdopterin-containing oxidoreductase family iron-sulfur binding subunit
LTAPALSRRSFLQAAGFTLASAATTGCVRPPPDSRLAHVVQPEIGAPGARLSYATTCAGCSAGCGVLASVRDARPLKLEGLPGHPVSDGRLCAAGQASILGLYDNHRIRRPLLEGRPVSWRELDERLVDALGATQGAVRIVTGTDAAASPTTRSMVARFLERFADARHVVHDVVSGSAIIEAHGATHGTRALPRMRIDRADIIVALDADFLGAGHSPVESAAAYARARPRWHVQVESCMTLTGAKADERFVVAPDEVAVVLTALAVAVARRAGNDFAASPRVPEGLSFETVERWGALLSDARGRALVICGSADPDLQRLANFVNELLGSYGATLDLEAPSRQRLGDELSMVRLGEELERGEVGVLIMYGVNPVHSLPDGGRWREWLAKVPVLVAMAERDDETSSLARYVCPAPHYLETWGDVEPVSGLLCLRQPTIEPTGDTRSFDASLAAWSGVSLDALAIVQHHWREHVYRSDIDGPSFQSFWDRSLQTGWVQRPVSNANRPAFDSSAVQPLARPLAHQDTLLLVAYPSVALQDGRQAFNPWLLELPDPVSQVSWDCCASLAPATAEALKLRDGDFVSVKLRDGDAAIELPVVVQPGQHERVVAVPLGYGQRVTDRFANLGPRWLGRAAGRDEPPLVGANVAPLLPMRGRGDPVPVEVRPVRGRRRELARAQQHAWLTSIDAGWGTEASGALIRRVAADHLSEAAGPAVHSSGSTRGLWDNDASEDAGTRWGMTIDLDACTGCSACVLACQVENNTPVVGRDEVRRHRSMHWLRIDRYYRADAQGVAIAHQPMTCHHCAHAPCETVCPVLATTRSSDGLNQQTYSRCIGTRYCMNNCPFKVRRFNWFDYTHDPSMENLVLNPDVTVRSRGVAEKCTFCVQRIQEARLAARAEGRELVDGDVRTACEQTCPASAITFGDLNDRGSRVSARAADPRAYALLEGLNLAPAVRYLASVGRRRPRTDDDHDA